MQMVVLLNELLQRLDQELFDFVTLNWKKEREKNFKSVSKFKVEAKVKAKGKQLEESKKS